MKMIVIVILDDRNGMMFNHRRQSQDRILRAHILDMIGGQKLWMNSYSAKLYGVMPPICVDDNFLDKAGQGEFCLVENSSLLLYEKKIENIVCFRWNQKYPGDFFLDIPLDNWKIVYTDEFAGSSHKKITKEIYER